MPWQGGTYIQDSRSPLERLYGYQDTMAKMQALKQQQDLMRERQKILSESLIPAQAGSMDVSFSQQPQAAMSFPQIFQQQLTGGAPTSAIGAQDLEQVKLTQTEAKPAQFDAESAISRLYGAGDLEGAQSIVNDQYKDSMAARASGSSEKWYGNGKMVKGADGKLYNQITSSAGNTKLVPIDGNPAGELKRDDLGGRVVWRDPFSGRVVIDESVTATPYQSFQMSPDAQAGVAGAVEGAKTKAEAKAKEDAGLESAASTYDKTLGIIDELIRHPGREFATGKSASLNILPGTEGADFIAKLDQLAGQNFLTEIQRMKGQGSLSDAEGRRLSDAAAALSTKRTDEGFYNELLKLRDELQFYKRRAERKRAESTPQKPAGKTAPKIGEIRNGYIFTGGNPADPKAWRKK